MRWTRLVHRLIGAVGVTLGIALTVFLVLRLAPGDPVDLLLGQEGNVTEAEVAALKEQFHLDQPLHVQAWLFLKGVATGDLGTSFVRGEPVVALLLRRLPATLEMAVGAMLCSVAIGVPVGVWAAVRRGRAVDRLLMGASFVGVSLPPFWLGMLLIMLFGGALQWLPVAGRIAYAQTPVHITGLYTLDALLSGDMPALVSALRHLALPSLTLGFAFTAVVARVLRSSLIEVLGHDYVRVARAKGLHERRVVLRHALRNALIPTVTLVGLEFSVLLSGNMVVETVFAWPGLGRLIVEAIMMRDYPVVQAGVMLYAILFVLTNLIVDIVYIVLNPRVEL